MNIRYTVLASAVTLLAAAPVMAQEVAQGGEGTLGAAAAASKSGVQIEASEQRSLNTFEAAKQSGIFEGLKISLGGAFTLGFQALDHSNTAAPRVVDGKDLNELGSIRPGFVLPTANLNLNVELAPGIKMVLESYMSSRNHNEFWVKGGYAMIDQSPIDLPVLNTLMERTTVRAGMYEPNYGDAHYRRSDNGNTINNPFVENYILDAFTTEPGADVLVRFGDAFVMGGVTSGQNKGDVKENPITASPAYVAKLGFDRQFSDALRFRLSGSAYSSSSTPGATLYGGDRAGSHYWGVIDNSNAAAFTNGRINPGFRNEMTAFQVNPFVKLGGIELFGVIEQTTGKAANETDRRTFNQYAGDALYRFLDDRFYVGGRYNTVSGDLAGMPNVSSDRAAIAAGWFISPYMLTKVEYVRQSYDGFPSNDIRNGAEFSGVVIQGSIAF